MEEKTGLFEAPLRAIRERIRVEVSRGEYLDRLAPEDKENILAILEKLENKKDLVGGRLIAIGGSVRDRDWNDIDLKILTEKDISVNVINQRVISAVEGLKRFNIKKGQVLDEERELKDCLYLSSKTGGKPIHLIPSTVKDTPAADHLAFDRFLRMKFCQLCKF